MSGNLPDIPANAIVANPNIPNQVFVGTDWGLYYTDNINAPPPVWQRFEGMPHVMIWSLSIDRGFTTLAAFTRSRGAWAWPLPQPPSGTGGPRRDRRAASRRRARPAVQLHDHGHQQRAGDRDQRAARRARLPAGFTSKGNSGDCTTDFPCVFPTSRPVPVSPSTTRDCVAARFHHRSGRSSPQPSTSGHRRSDTSNDGVTPTVPLIIAGICGRLRLPVIRPRARLCCTPRRGRAHQAGAGSTPRVFVSPVRVKLGMGGTGRNAPYTPRRRLHLRRSHNGGAHASGQASARGQRPSRLRDRTR